MIILDPPGVPEFDAERLIYAQVDKALDPSGQAIVDAKPEKPIEDWTAADYAPGIDKIWDSYRLLP